MNQTLQQSNPTPDALEEETVDIPIRHQNFISLVAAGLSYAEAYRRGVSPKATDGTCFVRGSRFAKRYALQIEEAAKKRQNRLQVALNNEVHALCTEKLLSHIKIAEFLCAVITGTRGMNGDPQGKATYYDLLKAMELYMKLTGGWPPYEKQSAIHDIDTIVVKANDPPSANYES